jgi:hypothetical protein
MAPPMMNNPLIFAEAFEKSDPNNNSLFNTGAKKIESMIIKVKKVYLVLPHANSF